MFSSLAAVNRSIISCTRCPRLRAYCGRVAREKKREFRDWEYWGKPVPGFGDPRARLLVVDSSGNWLFEALYRYGFASQPTALTRDDGLELTDCYISAVGRCAPPGNKPTHAELERCRPYLEAELRLLRRLRVVVTLGRVAHDGWLKAAGWWATLPPRERPAFGHGAVATLPDGTILLSSYHPSRQNTNTGKLTRPMWHAVFQKARRLIGE
ncbi:MAG: uracil-DNA glycosylase [Chloroflexi bacterium]|nr:MAG: uracil-DNA glycosylase [Chloroflexota bacterium]